MEEGRSQGHNRQEVVCPFNPEHRMPPRRFVWHVSQCKDRYQMDQVFRTCEFNALHILPESEYAGHVETCPDRPATDSIIFDRSLQRKFAEFLNKPPGYKLELSPPRSDNRIAQSRNNPNSNYNRYGGQREESLMGHSGERGGGYKKEEMPRPVDVPPPIAAAQNGQGMDFQKMFEQFKEMMMGGMKPANPAPMNPMFAPGNFMFNMMQTFMNNNPLLGQMAAANGSRKRERSRSRNSRSRSQDRRRKRDRRSRSPSRDSYHRRRRHSRSRSRSRSYERDLRGYTTSKKRHYPEPTNQAESVSRYRGTERPSGKWERERERGEMRHEDWNPKYYERNSPRHEHPEGYSHEFGERPIPMYQSHSGNFYD